jgi:hypothetical protein
MAGRGPTFAKRQREMDRDRKKRDKADKRVQRKTERDDRPDGDSEEDPDIAGIVPGPQPLPWDDEPSDDEPSLDG